MASTRSTIEIEIRAQVERFRDAVRGAEVQLRRMASVVERNDKAFDRLGKGISIMLKSLLAVGLIGNATGLIVGLTTAVVNLLPAALILPGALTAAAVAMGVFKLATAGVGDALGGDAEAMAKLAPSARAFVEQINALKPAFDGLRKSVQQKFFENFAGDVKNLSAIYLPSLQQRLPKIAEEFNRMGRSITRALTMESAQDDIAIILDNTATALGNMRQSLGHVVSGFLGLAAIGTDFLPRLGTAIDSVAFKFKHWVDRGVETGTLTASIEEALRQFGLLSDVVVNVGQIVAAVFRGLSTGPQKDFLQALKDSTQALEDFFNQADTQGQLGAIGKAFSEIAEVTRTVFLEALKQILPIVAELAPVFAEIAGVVGDLLVNAMKILGPILMEVARFLNDNKEAVADLAPLVFALFVAFKGASVLTSVAGGLRALSRALGGPIGLLKAGGLIALGGLAIKINDINKETAKIENRPLTDMEDSLDDIIGAGKEILTLNFDGIFSEIGSEWDELVTKFQTGESPIGGFFQRLGAALTLTGQSFSQIGTFIADFVAKTGESFGQIGTAIGTAFTTVVTAITTFFTTTIPTVVGGFFASIGTAISTGATTIGTTVSTTFTTMVDTVKAKITEIVTAIGDFLSQSPREIGLAIGMAIGDLITQIINFGVTLRDNVVAFMTDFGTQIQTGVTNAVTFLGELPGRALDALASLPETLATLAQQAGQAFLDWIDSFFTQTTDRAAEVPAQVGEAAGGVIDTLAQVASDAGAGFIQFLVDAFNNVINFATTVPGKIGSAISGLVSTLITKATEAGQGFLNTITRFLNDAVTFVASIPGRIVSAIGNLGNLLFNAGKELIDGLGRGIRSAYQGLLDFVGGIADGLAARKGPLSYDRIVMRPAGLALMEGLLHGLQEGNEDVQRFVSGIADQLADPFATTLAGSALTVSTLPPPAAALAASAQQQATDRLIAALSNQAVKVDVLLDGQPFAAMVTTAVVEQDRESARRVRAGGGTSW